MNHWLVEIIKAYCLQRGDFVLSSGIRSDYYIDLRKLVLSHHIGNVCRELVEHIWAMNLRYEALGGPETGANALVAGSLMLLDEIEESKRGFAVRRAPKVYRNKSAIYGSVLPVDRCILIEDVTTTGTSLGNAAQAVLDFGCTTVHAITIVDRMQGAKKLLAQMDIELTSLLTVKDLEL